MLKICHDWICASPGTDIHSQGNIKSQGSASCIVASQMIMKADRQCTAKEILTLPNSTMKALPSTLPMNWQGGAMEAEKQQLAMSLLVFQKRGI